jgi:hypothetical protein
MRDAACVSLGAMNNTSGDGLYWFKIVQTHPHPEFETVIRSFIRQTAADLEIAMPPVAWYEKADWVIASEAFNDAHRSHSELRWSQDDDPTTLPCEYFRVSPEGPFQHSGYTPFNSRTILIASDGPKEHVLRAVPDECYHVKQDAIHGSGWRKAHRDIADAEADAYSNSKEAKILELLALHAGRS